MQVKGRLEKVGKFWAVQCPVLQMDTQGRTKAEALEMAADWVRTMLDDPEFEVDVQLAGDGEFVMSFSDPRPILGLIVQRTRSATGMTLDQVGKRIGKGERGRSYVKTYETGKHDPKFTTAQELFQAMGYELQIELVKKPEKKRA